MEKLKEIVIKLANNFPNKALSETQKSIIQDRLNGFLSVLHTPDHPPYAWMIERALQELNEKSDSSEESISKFIRKEYDDLPGSHFTLLKHQIQALCDSENIILIKGHHYLLAGADATRNSCKKSQKKQKRTEQDSDQDIKWNKRYKRSTYKESTLQKEDQIHEKRNCMIEGLEQQSLKAEARKDKPEEDGEQVDGNQPGCERRKHLHDNTIDNQVLPIQSAKPSSGEHKSEAITGVAEGRAVSSRLSICSKQQRGFPARKFSELGASDMEESLPIAAPPKSVLASSVCLKQADPGDFSKLTSLQMHPDIEPQNQAPKHPPEKRVLEGKTSRRVLRPRPLKPEQSNAQTSVDLSPSCGQHDVQQQPRCCRRRPEKVKLESGIISDELVFFPDHHPRQQLHKHERKHRGRPPKHGLGVSTSIHKEMAYGAQQHTPTKRGRGRPRKEQEGEKG